jgi:hypothetical protein
VPVLNFNTKPFNGQKFDPQILKRAQMWKGNEDAQEESKGINREKPKNYSEINSTHFLSIPIALTSADI